MKSSILQMCESGAGFTADCIARTKNVSEREAQEACSDLVLARALAVKQISGVNYYFNLKVRRECEKELSVLKDSLS